VRTMAASSGRVCSTRSVSLFLQTLLCSCMICTSLCTARALATPAGAAGSGTDLVYSYCSIWLPASSRGPSLSLDHQRLICEEAENFSVCLLQYACRTWETHHGTSTVLLRYFFGDCVCVGMREYHLRGNHMVGLLNSLDRRPKLQ